MKIGILGFGLTGYSVAKLALKHNHQVFISESKLSSEFYGKLKSEKKNFDVEFGGHSEKLLECDIIVKSPGISNNIAILKQIRRKHLKIISELDFALENKTPEKIIAITGTNGKTTTTALVGEIMKSAGKKTYICGNIGKPISDIADDIDEKTVVVMEVSSYQLEDSNFFHPRISAILNITPDHLEHHKTFKNYVAAKAKIFKYQDSTDFCILNYDDKICRTLAASSKSNVIFFSRKKRLKEGVYFSEGRFCCDLPFARFSIPADTRLPGLHNVENILAAIGMSVAADVKTETIKKTISSFKGVEHRLEAVRVLNGVKYINDSKATNVDSTMKALESVDGNVWLILGGRDKGSPYAPLKPIIRRKVKGLLLIGEAADKINKELEAAAKTYFCRDMANAVAFAHKAASPGDTVLLSPACASFDQFKNFEHRGKVFKKIVNSL